MLARACTIFGLWAMLIAAPAWGAGGRYDPDYPVCMEVVDTSGGRIECRYESIAQCRQFTFGAGGTCFNNPNYVPPPAGATPSQAAPAETEPAQPTKPAKSAGRYDPDYPVCMEVADTSGGRIDCSFTAMAQCQAATGNFAATCINNPAYVPPPPEPASPQAAPAPPVKAAKPKKSAKSAKSPPSPQPAPSR
jgi:Protein of unknown function (DUF3551)